MTDDFKNQNGLGENEPVVRKRPSVKAEDESFANDIPVPPAGEDGENKPHKIVRVVEVAPQKKEYNEEPSWDDEKKKAKKDKKGGFVGEFFAGAAAGAKAVGENISGKKDKKSSEPKAEKTKAPEKKAEAPKAAPKASAKKSGGSIMDKISALPSGAVIGGAVGILVVLIAFILIVSTSCGTDSGNKPAPGPDNSGSGIEISSSVDGENEAEGPEALVVPSRLDNIAEAFNANNDVVGWLRIPGMPDVDAGVAHDPKTYSYNKRDITGKKVSSTYWIDGAYYTHLRNTFGPTSEDLSTNTVIFGHSDLGITNLAYTNDDPNGPLFSQLFKFKDPNFAEQTPYIYFSTPDNDYVWEVFSVFYNDSKIDGGKALWYIEPEPGAKYQDLLDTVQSRSLYKYDVEVTDEDQILTLSTCTVGFGLGNRERYRFVIVAKLVENPEELVLKNASFTINAGAPVPDTYAEEFKGYAENWKPSEEIKTPNGEAPAGESGSASEGTSSAGTSSAGTSSSSSSKAAA